MLAWRLYRYVAFVYDILSLYDIWYPSTTCYLLESHLSAYTGKWKLCRAVRVKMSTFYLVFYT